LGRVARISYYPFSCGIILLNFYPSGLRAMQNLTTVLQVYHSSSPGWLFFCAAALTHSSAFALTFSWLFFSTFRFETLGFHYALKHAADNLFITLLYLQVQELIPDIKSLRKGREQAFKHCAAAFRGSRRGVKLKTSKL